MALMTDIHGGWCDYLLGDKCNCGAIPVGGVIPTLDVVGKSPHDVEAMLELVVEELRVIAKLLTLIVENTN
jgi:hypothetical protein